MHWHFIWLRKIMLQPKTGISSSYTRICLYPCKSLCVQFDRCLTHWHPRVVFHWKISCVGLYHQPLHCFTPCLLQWCLLIRKTPFHQKCDLERRMICCEDFLWKVGCMPSPRGYVRPNWLIIACSMLSSRDYNAVEYANSQLGPTYPRNF